MDSKRMSFVLWCTLLFTIHVNGSRYCSWSKETVKVVSSCPTTKAEVEQRKQIKNCEAMAKLQNCTEPHKFLYHCVIDDLENSLVEVCAPLYVINGYCAEYNIVGAVIQPHFTLRCSDVSPQCAARYNSTDAYLYKGCYAAVQRYAVDKTNQTTLTTEVSVTFGKTTDILKEELRTEVVAGIYLAVIGILTVVICAVILYVRRKRRKKKKRNTELKKEDTGEQVPLITGKMEAFQEHFAQTQIAADCFDILNKNGMIIIIGKQGCGKTMTANHIMNNTIYKDWTKTTINSLEDLSLHENTIFFIDNLFDGYQYCQSLGDCWDKIFDFFYRDKKERHSMRLIITANDNDIKKAEIFIKEEKLQLLKQCYMGLNSNLSDNEKLQILKNQYNLAKKMIKVDRTFFEEKAKDLISMESDLIGFPLCAHIYAFGESETNTTLFINPKSSVLKKISDEIEKDNTNGVKTLFLLLLFYWSQSGSSNSKIELDLKSKEECHKFLHDKCPQKMLNHMKKLSFKDLNDTAKALEGVILIKEKNMFKFKHRIYLEGVGTYFVKHYFDVAVKNFPTAILKFCDIDDLSSSTFDKFIDRLCEDIRGTFYFEVFSCEMLQTCKTEQKVYDKLRETRRPTQFLDSVDRTTVFKLPMMFWASKYKVSKMEMMLLEFAGDSKDDRQFQFYLARFGECCAADERYIFSIEFRKLPTIKQLQSSVCNFRTSEGETVLHILLSSNKSDYDVARFLTELLEKSTDLRSTVDRNLLNFVLTQNKHSRLLCMLKILSISNDASIHDSSSIANLANEFNRSSNEHFKREILCRRCILIGYGEDISLEAFNYCISLDNRGDFSPINDRIVSIKELQEEMESCCSSSNTEIPIKLNVTEKLKEAIKNSIQILAKREEEFSH